MVNQQHQMFDTLWEKAISLSKRIEQIEARGKYKQEGIELIYDKQKVIDRTKQL